MSLRQSMYTGLAQPEVKTNGRFSKNSTAFTSSSILAVVSAMNAWSAKCMSGANFNRLESAYLALHGESCDGTGANNNLCNGADHRVARRARSIHARPAHLPLRRQGRQEILRLDGAHAVPRPADRAAQYFRHGRQANQPGGRRERARGEGEGHRYHQRQVRPGQAALPGADRPQVAQPESLRRSTRLTSSGSALPFVAFMTCPTRELKAFSLPAR